MLKQKMNLQYAAYLLKKTREDYNLIAEEFSRTRYSIWPELNLFGKYVMEEDKILDLGCGNGRLIELFKNKGVDYFGIDNSEKLIEIAKEKYPKAKFQVADVLNLPFPDNYFDKIFNIAVLHHIPSNEFRLNSLKEARRVVKPGGLLILTVWDLWQRQIAWELLFKYAFLKIIGKSKLDFKDIFYPWKSQGGKILIQRYFHLFTKSELKRLVEKSVFRIKEAGIFEREETRNHNIYIIAEKSNLTK